MGYHVIVDEMVTRHLSRLSDNPPWHTCPLGHPFAESDLLLRTSELARFTRLLLDEGVWSSRRLVPAEYCRRMSEETVPTDLDMPAYTGYGLGVWHGLGERAFRMDGKYGQFGVVSPERETVVTVTAHTERDFRLLDLIRDEILEKL